MLGISSLGLKRGAVTRGTIGRMGSLVALLTTMVLGADGGHVLAAGDPHWGGLAPGQQGALGPQPTVEQLRITQLKLSYAEYLQKGMVPPQSLYDELGQLTKVSVRDRYHTATTGGTASVAPLYQQGNWYYASVDGNTNPWIEPAGDPANEAPVDQLNTSNFFPNMCGPGSAVKLLSNWIPNLGNVSTNHAGAYFNSGYKSNYPNGRTNSGAQGLMLSLGLPTSKDPNGLGMMDQNDSAFPGAWNTAPGKEAAIINSYAHINWYW